MASLEAQRENAEIPSHSQRSVSDHTRDAVVDFIGGIAGRCMF